MQRKKAKKMRRKRTKTKTMTRILSVDNKQDQLVFKENELIFDEFGRICK